jgi:hypothetical protein
MSPQLPSEIASYYADEKLTVSEHTIMDGIIVVSVKFPKFPAQHSIDVWKQIAAAGFVDEGEARGKKVWTMRGRVTPTYANSKVVGEHL